MGKSIGCRAVGSIPSQLLDRSTHRRGPCPFIATATKKTSTSPWGSSTTPARSRNCVPSLLAPRCSTDERRRCFTGGPQQRGGDPSQQPGSCRTASLEHHRQHDSAPLQHPDGSCMLHRSVTAAAAMLHGSTPTAAVCFIVAPPQPPHASLQRHRWCGDAPLQHPDGRRKLHCSATAGATTHRRSIGCPS